MTGVPDIQQHILNALPRRGAVSGEDLLARTGLPSETLVPMLSVLVESGQVLENSRGYRLPALTGAERQAAMRAEHAAAGRTRRELFTTDDEFHALRERLAELRGL